MGNRSRLVYVGDVVAGLGQSITISEILPFNATLIQISVFWSGAPITPSPISIFRVISTPQFPVQSFLIKEIDPTIAPQAWIICNDTFEFRRNDLVILQFANLDDINAVIEVIFKEAD